MEEKKRPDNSIFKKVTAIGKKVIFFLIHNFFLGWVTKFEKILRNVFSGVEKDKKVSAKSIGVGSKVVYLAWNDLYILLVFPQFCFYLFK